MNCFTCRSDRSSQGSAVPCDDTGKCPFFDDPEVEGTVPVESADVVRIWRTYKALGEWALPYLGIEMSPDEARETIDLIYELEVYNNQLRNQHTDPKTGGGTRLLWDLR